MLINKKVYRGIIYIITLCCFNACTPISNNNAEIRKPVIEAANPYAAVDKSVMDISYFPVNYPLLKMNGTDSNGLAARLIYSRPQKNGRTVFGSEKCIQQYGTYWRLGANEASEIEFFKPANINGQKIPKGCYIIYCIPYETTWIIMLNSNLFSWGLHPDTSKDIAKIEIPVLKTDKSIDVFTMVFQPTATGAGLFMAWDNVTAVLPITFD
jgi:Protein of unknown function (DUF2911)